MSKFMYNGKPYGGSTNYASSVTCTDAEGNESTVQAEIDKNRDDIDELNKNLSLLSGAKATTLSYTGALTANNSIALGPMPEYKQIFSISKIKSATSTGYDNGTIFINSSGFVVFKPETTSTASDIAVVILYK